MSTTVFNPDDDSGAGAGVFNAGGSAGAGGTAVLEPDPPAALDPNSGAGAGDIFDPDAGGGAGGIAGPVSEGGITGVGPITSYCLRLDTPRHLWGGSQELVSVSIQSDVAAFTVEEARFALQDHTGAPAPGFGPGVRLDAEESAASHRLSCPLDATALGGYYALTVSALCDDGSALPQTVVLEAILYID